VSSVPPDEPTERIGLPVVPPSDGATPTGQPVSAGAKTPQPRSQKIIMWVSLGVIALVVLIGLFILGTRIGEPTVAAPTPTPSASVSATPTPTPTPTETVAAVGPVAPGVYQWDELLGKECVDPYVSPWEQTFTVVDCAAGHHAQLTSKGSFGGDATTPYPGDAALKSQLNLLCTGGAALNLGAAGAYADLQFQASYPATDAKWAKGDRFYYCFVSRSGGDVLTGSLAP
jgi:hypothetical protein